jgi:hypothetical protein
VSQKLRIVVLGAMGRIPFAGMAWEALHYVEGFRRLGHDVYYIEDTGDWPYMPSAGTSPADACRATAAYIQRMMIWCGLPDRWAYRAAAQRGRVYGLSESEFHRIFREADALVNLTVSTVLRDEHLRVPVRVYLQTDPGAGEIRLAQGHRKELRMLQAHRHFFNFAENIGSPDCLLPEGPVRYHLTRQPIVLEWFTPPEGLSRNGRRTASVPLRFTTVGNWKQAGCDIRWQGRVYTWSKHHEFLKFLELPRRVGQPVELALSSISRKDARMLASYGWRVVDAYSFTTDILPYRDYLFGSDAEFTVAKDQNVRLRTGWFSERSASYLTAGKPVITQDTGFGRALPTGEGLFAFNTMDEIVSAFDAIRSDYKRHSRAARDIAEEYFRAETVLAKFIEDMANRPHGEMRRWPNERN